MLRLFIFIILPIYLFATPTWYGNISSKSYEIIGYGIDTDLQIARNIAKSEISKQISIKISSNSNIKKILINDDYQKSFKSNISTSTDATLQGIKILKEEYTDNKWYVGVIYDNRTLLQKINIKYPKYSSNDMKNIKKLNVIRKSNNWYIKIKNDLYILSNDNFINIFSNKKSKNIELISDKIIYNSYDKIHFEINSKNKGYVSILYSEASGKSAVILSNKTINHKIVYPKQNGQDELVAYNPSNNTIIEWYICIYSKKKLDLSEFENISANILDESNYNFDKLLDIIKHNEYVSTRIKIRGK